MDVTSILRRALEQLDGISASKLSGEDAGRLVDASHKVELVIRILEEGE